MKSKSIRSKVMTGLVLACMVISTSSVAFGATTVSVNNNIETKLSALVTAGTITSAQVTSIEAALTPSGNVGGEKGGPSGNLDALVTAGTITAAQQTAIETALKAADKNEAGIKTALDTLVTAGTITATQETAVTTAFTSSHSGFGEKGGNSGNLGALVTAGTITAAQQTAIETALKTADKSATGIKTALDTLVTAGTITATQETSNNYSFHFNT